jgi:hypothetical protein
MLRLPLIPSVVERCVIGDRLDLLGFDDVT